MAALSSAYTLEAKLKLSAIIVDTCNDSKLELFMTYAMLFDAFLRLPRVYVVSEKNECL